MASQGKFNLVDTKVSFVELEKKLLENWYKKGIVKKYLSRNKTGKKYFSFLDGPITANNPMGVHHAWGRTYKDLWQRYKNMQGYKQRFQNGFDCQGLWVEVEVEKELGLKNKKDIENLIKGSVKKSIAKFVDLCKKRVYKFADIQTEQSKRLGYFMDWDNSYYTLSDENNYMIWHFLKKCHERGLIYKGRDSVPWCPRCGTAISQHEMLTEDYKEAKHETVFLKFPVKYHNFSLLVWTTTPWTIPANVAVAVNPKFMYRTWTTKTGEKVLTVNPDEIKDLEAKKWFEENLLKSGLVHERSVGDMRGAGLLNLKYEAPFDDLPAVAKAKEENQGTFHSIVPAEDLVVATKGTGLLHVAPGSGEEDFQLAKDTNLPVIEAIDESANYLEEMGGLGGKNAKDHPEIVIDYLEQKEGGRFLLKTAPILHRYPACWRCKAELVWRVVDEWYISMDEPLNSKLKTQNSKLRDQMKEVARKISWIPDFGLSRELDWLENMHDWLISKKRYWGLALPIWECKKCGGFEVIGGREELKERVASGWKKFDGHSPHRPWVDEVKIKCGKCGEVAERIPDVGNPWLDAGIVPFSTVAEDNKGKPLYTKDRDEWTKWFPANFITESFPGQFKNWFYSLIAMSTVLENTEPFKTVLGFGTLFGEDGRPMHKSSGNAIEFNEGADKIGVDVMRWMYAKADPSQNLLFGYKLADETRRGFHLTLWNVYNFFVTYADTDGFQPSKFKDQKLKIKITTQNPKILDRWIMTRLHETVGMVTNSLDRYDARTATGSIEEFVQDLSLWYVRRSRDRVGPAAADGEDKNSCHATLHYVLTTLSKLLAPFTPFISEEIYQNLTGEESVHLADWPAAEKLGAREEQLVVDMQLARKIVEKGHGARKESSIPVRQPLASISVTCNSSNLPQDILQLIKDELNVKDVTWNMKNGASEPEVQLDKKITPNLLEEGKARELARQIQEERKKLGAPLDAVVDVGAPWLPTNNKLLEWIKTKTLSRMLKKAAKLTIKIS